jgi:hypothetical protein
MQQLFIQPTLCTGLYHLFIQYLLSWAAQHTDPQHPGTHVT